jgi:hypothetical protein
VPLVVLARPRLVGYLIWQAAEVGYFYAIWGYLITVVDPTASGAVSSDLYFTAVLARFCTVICCAAWSPGIACGRTAMWSGQVTSTIRRAGRWTAHRTRLALRARLRSLAAGSHPTAPPQPAH